MGNAFVAVQPDSTGKKVQTFENVIGAQTVEAQAAVLVDSTGVEINPRSIRALTTADAVSATIAADSVGLAKDATLTGGTAKAVVRGGAKGVTAAADVTSTASGANHQGADVVLYDASGNLIDPRAIRALTSADVVSAAQSGAWSVGVNNFPATQPVSGTVTAGQGAAAAIASAWPVKVTDGTTAAIVDATLKALRISERPFEGVGFYSVNARTPTYGGLAAAAPLVQFRNPSATILILILRVRVQVMTIVSASTAGASQRELVVGRSWTVSDTGTAISLAGNANKRRTSHATSIADMKVGGALTAGTRTLDGNGMGSPIFWMPLTTVGVALAPTTLFDVAQAGGAHPIVLTQNEGVLVRFGPDAQPSGATNQTYVEIDWAEATSY